MADSGWMSLADQDTKKAIQESSAKVVGSRVGCAARAKAGSGRLPSYRHERPCTDAFAMDGRSRQNQTGTGEIRLRVGPVSVPSVGTAYHFDPEKDGAITAAEKLTSGKPAWKLVWATLQGSTTLPIQA